MNGWNGGDVVALCVVALLIGVLIGYYFGQWE